MIYLIRLLDIKEQITKLLKSKFKYKVHFDNVEKSNEPYFYVEMLPRHKTIDKILTDKSIQIDIMFILLPDEFGRIKRSILYDAADTLDCLIRPVIQIKDRHITILDSQIKFHDEVLHYIFDLEFADCLSDEESENIVYDLMQNIELNLK